MKKQSKEFFKYRDGDPNAVENEDNADENENLDVVEVNQDDPEYLATVLVALQYNKKPLMKFLKKGDIPFVGRIRMSLIELATRIENTLG